MPVFWSAAGLAAIAMAAFLFRVSNPVEAFSDFSKAYWLAGRDVLSGPDALEKSMSKGAFGFVNIPIVAYLFVPFGMLEKQAASILFTAIGVGSVVLTWWLLARMAGLQTLEKALFLFLIAAFGPLAYSLKEGNTTHMVLALVTGALYVLRRKREMLAGALLGIAAVIKLPLLLFGAYFLLRGRWRVVIGGGSILAAVGLSSVLIFGWDSHLQWYESCVKPYARDPIAALNVQSIAGALLRFELGPASLLDWRQHPLSPVSQAIASASTLAILGLAMAACLAPRPRASRDVGPLITDEVEFMIVLMIACVASPLTWSHYYTWMLLPLAFFLGRTPHFASSPSMWAVNWIALVAASPVVSFWRPRSELLGEFVGRIGASHLLIAGLLLLGTLLWSRWHLRNACAEGAPSLKPARSSIGW